AHPVATLTLTASATDPVTGAVATASPQTIAVTDPRPATTTTTTSPQTITQTAPQLTPAASTGFLANQGFAQQHADPVTNTVATTAPQPISVTDHLPATGKTMAALASQSFALLNQYLAGNTGRVD